MVYLDNPERRRETQPSDPTSANNNGFWLASTGVRLFHRTARAVSLTDEGRRFFEEVRPLLAGIEDAATKAAGATAVVRGRLRINTDTAFGQFILAPKLPKLLSIYPDLEVEIAVRSSLGDLVADGFDLAVRFGEPESPSLIGHKILETRVLTLRSASLPRAARDAAAPQRSGRRGARVYSVP